jgi:hypothetical protein
MFVFFAHEKGGGLRKGRLWRTGSLAKGDARLEVLTVTQSFETRSRYLRAADKVSDIESV